jgi:hypothetical protein
MFGLIFRVRESISVAHKGILMRYAICDMRHATRDGVVSHRCSNWSGGWWKNGGSFLSGDDPWR